MQTSWMGCEGETGHVQLVQTGGGVTLIITIIVIVISIFTRRGFYALLGEGEMERRAEHAGIAFAIQPFLLKLTIPCSTAPVAARRLSLRCGACK